MAKLNMFFVYSGLFIIVILLILLFVFCFKGVKETFQTGVISYSIPGYYYSNGMLINPTDQDAYNQLMSDINLTNDQARAAASLLWQDKQAIQRAANASSIWKQRQAAGNKPPAGPGPVQWPYPQLSAIGSKAVTVCPFAGCVGVGYGNVFNNPGYGNVVVTGADYFDPNNPDFPACINVNLEKESIPPGYVQPGTPCI